KPTLIERATAVLREIDGSAELAGRALKSGQKDITVADGDRLTTQGVVRLTLAPDRTLLLAPRAQVVFKPSKERLTILLEQGELIAELNAPGAELLVATKTCEVRHLGTIFSVKAEERRTLVLVEEGRVDVRSPKGSVTARAGQAVVASETAAPAAVASADVRLPAWTRAHRPAERVLYLEEFNAKGDWTGQVEGGAARTVRTEKLGGGTLLTGDSVRHLFEVPARGQMAIVYQADRAGRLKVQMFSNELRSNYKIEVPLNKTQGWKTLVFDFDDLTANLPTAPPKPTPGAGFSNLMLQYDEDGDRGNLWIDSIRVISIR
ncbi:MAG TPA: FecR domain-containing protein, partial [Planctomycetota bacterium]